MLSGVVLAGGRSRRMGRDKAQLVFEGQTLLERTIGTLREVADEVLVSGFRERSAQVPAGVRVIEDAFPDAGPLAGIYSALLAAAHPHVLAVAVDMPFLNVGLLRYMASIAAEYDAVVPKIAGQGEQLHAIYGKTCIPLIRAQLERGDFKIDRWFGQANVRFLTEKDIEPYDPHHRSFMNANTPDEWQRVAEGDAR